MAENQDQDRSEAATPFRLAEARKKGQVARSADLVGAAVFAVAVLLLYSQGVRLIEDQFRFDRLLMNAAPRLASAGGGELAVLAFSALAAAVGLIAPVLVTLMVVSALVSMAQTGAVFSPQALQPDWSRINPVEGFKRILSLRTLFETFRAVVKLVVMVWVAVIALRDLAPHFHQLGSLPARGFLHLLVADAALAGVKMAIGLLIISAVDLAYTRREFSRKMRMSRREIKDETKHREGDPRIRSRLRELRQEMLKRSRSVHRTKQADVVVTNPTHYAVALAYRHGQMAAPRVVAKGSGGVALAMREMATRHSIPVVPKPSLARALYAATEVDDTLPEMFYREVAQLMTWVIALRKARSAPVGGAQ
ncbi:MAG TPA: EscU/YscU/HrcU family type III secretion system export apparatus switch protein [Anaerolineae bacterium]|nr:EscU/YscU/HrcU family type III secretion system export apparatus switch protein [Anaerolineae bacterium]